MTTTAHTKEPGLFSKRQQGGLVLLLLGRSHLLLEFASPGRDGGLVAWDTASEMNKVRGPRGPGAPGILDEDAI